MSATSYHDRIRHKLTAAFQPILLEIKDDSAHHAGHAGHDPKGETHFSVRIVSESFANQSKVARHRLVYKALAEELQERVHALSLDIAAPNDKQP